jgi:sensor domain CHASE-containing protein
MGLRAKVLVLVVLVLMVTTAALYLVAETVLKRSYERLEVSLAQEDIARVRNAFDQNADGLIRTALDWATWDETFTFVADGNEAFVTTNLGDTAIQNLKLNLMIFANAAGQVVKVKKVGVDWELSADTAAWLCSHLRPDAAAANTADQQHRHGIVSLAEADLLFAAAPIRKSDGTGKPNGFLIVARAINPALVAELAGVTNLNFALTRVRGALADTPADRMMASLSPAAPDAVQPTGRNSLTAYALFTDALGKPCFVARIAKDRAVVAQGEKTAKLFLALLGSAGVAVILLAALLLDRLVLSRLLQFKTEIEAVSAAGNCDRRVSRSGDDEIADLADATNVMLGNIAKAEASRRESEQKLAQRVADLEKAAAHIQQLQGLLPICAWCKRVRDDGNYWHQIDDYIQRHTDVEFTHSICPDCSAKLMDKVRRNPGDTTTSTTIGGPEPA